MIGRFQSGRTLRAAALFAATLAWAPTVAAQAPTLIGVTSGLAPDLSHQRQCAPHVPLCAANGGLSGHGGAAFNPVRGTLFYTDGTTIYEIDTYGGACNELCRVVPARVLGGHLEGLTFDAARRELLALESRAGAAVVHTFAWDAVTCLTAGPLCVVGNLPSPNHRGGGITYDAVHDAVHVAMSVASGPADTWLLSWPRSAPCQTQCRTALLGCALGAVRALAFDPRDGTLYASDGSITAGFALAGLCQTPTSLACCTALHPAHNTWAGFDIDPCPVRGSVAPFGLPGCNGSNGLPPIHDVTHGNGVCGPLQGTLTTYSVSQGRPFTVGVVHFGIFSNFWNGIPLPLDLGFVGMTGCYLNHDLVVSVGIGTDAAGNGALSFVWPVNRLLVGYPLYTTVLLIDAGSNPLGAVHSNSMIVSHGSR